MTLSKPFHNLFAPLILAVFPSRCIQCGRFLPVSSAIRHPVGEKTDWFRPEHLFRRYACRSCMSQFLPISSPLCPSCGIPFQTQEDRDHVCQECIARPRRFVSARSAAAYDGILRTAVHLLKYEGKIQLARPMGRLLFPLFRQLMDQRPVDRILPVPLHTSRLRKRGFNQADLLIREWKQLLAREEPDKEFPPIRRGWLKRVRKTPPQTGMGKEERRKNIRGAFQVEPRANVKGKWILLVDDVYTTGATLDECARSMLSAGAAGILALTVARTLQGGR